MRISHDMQRTLNILGISLIVLVCTFLAKVYLIPLPEPSTPWNEYRVYAFVPDSENGSRSLSQEEFEEVRSIFTRHGYDELLHRRAQRLNYFTYEGERDALLSTIREEFEPSDPLYDPYMRGVGKFFHGELHGEDAELIYIPSRSASLIDDYRLHGDLDRLGNEYAVSGVFPKLRFIGAGIGLVVALLLLIPLTRRDLMLYLFGLVPLVVGVASSLFFVISQTVLLIVGWALFVGMSRGPLCEYVDIGSARSRRSLRLGLTVYIAFSAASLLLSACAEPDERSLLILQQTMAVAAQLSVAGIYLSLRMVKSRRYEHLPFYPEHIRRKNERLNPGLRGTAVAVLLVMSLFPLLFSFYLSGKGEILLPIPIDLASLNEDIGEDIGEQNTKAKLGSGFSWENVRRLSSFKRSTMGEERNERRLPDIAEYVTHRAYQESYFYGRGYEFPVPGEKVTVTRYRREGETVIPEERVMKMFTDQWYEDIIEEAYENGATRLLLAQKGPTRVRKDNVRLLHMNKRTMWGHAGIYLCVPLILCIVKRRKQHQDPLSKKNSSMRNGRRVA